MEEMMETVKMVLFTLIMASMMIASVALAQPSIDKQGGERRMQLEPRGPLGQLVKFQHQNLTLDVLAELTGLDADTIAAELSHPSEILVTYDIDIDYCHVSRAKLTNIFYNI
jgi:hypothetical protein